MNPATEFIQALVYPRDPDCEFSAKHLAEFACEVFADPYLKIKDLSIMIGYILPLIADKAVWPGQRERIRKRFAKAIGGILKMKYRYRKREYRYDLEELIPMAAADASGLIRECRKVDDDEFAADTIKEIDRNLQLILNKRNRRPRTADSAD